ncbi:MAG TPA: carboxypeptidase-like regulatory domain-containing protein, partial [Cyclobacteriaceae bacterium]|nr:carboxypeptidase-like regulatory domain-containing protein [Cyclobacteriaceae bacterium]
MVLRVIYVVCFLLLSFGLQSVQAQTDIIVTGTVTDNSGAALPGVNIIIENTTNGTVTNLDGTYSIRAASN